MSTTDPSDDKREALRRSGTLNAQSDEVRDELFRTGEFFDARDLVQVKYEMLRRVEHDAWSVTRSAETFGYSRPTFYQARESFESEGLEGLVPERRGPRGPRKLTRQIQAWVDERRAGDPSLGASDLARAVEEAFGVELHPRTITRYLAGQKKR
jgi:transposase